MRKWHIGDKIEVKERFFDKLPTYLQTDTLVIVEIIQPKHRSCQIKFKSLTNNIQTTVARSWVRLEKTIKFEEFYNAECF